MIDLLRDLVELESPTGDVAAMRDRMADELRALGAEVALDGEHVRADFPGAGAPLVLLGHVDTVWPRGTLARMPWRLENGRAYGPGVFDMKAGLVVMVEAIRLARTARALRVLLTADEVRVPTLAERDRLDELLRTLEPETPGTRIAAEGGWTRPPLERSEGSTVLFEQARAHGRELGLELRETAAPGGSDGNLIGALGVPVLDGLGAIGAGSHADDEHVLVESLPIRAQLLAAILRNPGL